MRLVGRGRLTVRRLFSSSRGCFRQHRCLQLGTGPHLGHARHLWQLWGLREFGRRRRLNCSGIGRGCRRSRNAWLRNLRWLGRLHRRQGVALAFNFMSFDRRLSQIFNVNRRGRWGHSAGNLRSARRGSLRRRRHRENRRLFLNMIEHDGLLGGRVGDDAGFRQIEAHLAITRAPHARCRLLWRPATGRLRLGRAVGAGRRSRNVGNLGHSGGKCSTQSEAIFVRNFTSSYSLSKPPLESY